MKRVAILEAEDFSQLLLREAASAVLIQEQ
jgi:hypothetical protein